MKRYIRFGPPELDAERESGKVPVKKKSVTKPKSLSTKQINELMDSIEIRLDNESDLQGVSDDISKLKKQTLSSAQQERLNELQACLTDILSQ